MFDCSGFKQADQYTTKKKEIEEYIGRTYDFGSDIKSTVKLLRVPGIVPPADPPNGSTETEKLIWCKQVEAFVKRGQILKLNMKKAYTLVWGQCLDVMRAKVEACANFEQIDANKDVIDLLKEIKNVAYKSEDTHYLQYSMFTAWKHFYNFKQGTEDSNAKYYKQF